MTGTDHGREFLQEFFPLLLIRCSEEVQVQEVFHKIRRGPGLRAQDGRPKARRQALVQSQPGQGPGDGFALEPAQTQGQLEPDPRLLSHRHCQQSREQLGKLLSHPDGMLPHPWARVLQRQGQGFGIEGGEAFQGVQRVQAALGGFSLADQPLQRSDGRSLTPLDQQALGRESPPAVGMGEKPNQAPGVRSGQ